MGRHYSHDDRRDRKTGGAGSLTHPLTDEDYRRQMDKLAGVNRADSEEEDDTIDTGDDRPSSPTVVGSEDA